MKKVLALVVCVAMLACCTLVASAASAVTLSVNAGEAKAIDDVIAVNISIAEKDTGIAAIEMLVSYDPDKFEVVPQDATAKKPKFFVAGEAATAGGALIAGNEAENPVKVSAISSDGIYDAGTLVTMYFKVKAFGGEIKATVASDILDADKAVIATAADVNAAAKGATVAEPIVPSSVVPSSVPSSEVSNTSVVPSTNVEPSTVVTEDVVSNVTPNGNTENPKTADNAALAFAGVLCAVMAAAYVVTKKVND